MSNVRSSSRVVQDIINDEAVKEVSYTRIAYLRTSYNRAFADLTNDSTQKDSNNPSDICPSSQVSTVMKQRIANIQSAIVGDNAPKK